MQISFFRFFFRSEPDEKDNDGYTHSPQQVDLVFEPPSTSTSESNTSATRGRLTTSSEAFVGSSTFQLTKRKRKRKVTRRGRKKCNVNNVTNFVLVHSNCSGIKSKLQSINHVVNNLLTPDIVSLNEHGVSGRNKVNIDNFHSFSKNRNGKRMGGVSLSIPKDNLPSYLKIKEGKGNDEYIIV